MNFMEVLAQIWDFVFAILAGAGVQGLENFKNPFRKSEEA